MDGVRPHAGGGSFRQDLSIVPGFVWEASVKRIRPGTTPRESFRNAREQRGRVETSYVCLRSALAVCGISRLLGAGPRLQQIGRGQPSVWRWFRASQTSAGAEHLLGTAPAPSGNSPSQDGVAHVLCMSQRQHSTTNRDSGLLPAAVWLSASGEEETRASRSTMQFHIAHKLQTSSGDNKPEL